MSKKRFLIVKHVYLSLSFHVSMGGRIFIIIPIVSIALISFIKFIEVECVYVYSQRWVCVHLYMSVVMFSFMEYKNTYILFLCHNLSYESPPILGPTHWDFITVFQESHMCKIVFCLFNVLFHFVVSTT